MSDNRAESTAAVYHVPYEDYHERFMKYSGPELREICRTLSSDDQVLINKREKTLRVREVEDCRDLKGELGDTGHVIDWGPDGHCVHLEGNETRYEIHVPREPAENRAPTLVHQSGNQVVGYLDVIVDGEVFEPPIRSSVNAADILGDDLR